MADYKIRGCKPINGKFIGFKAGDNNKAVDGEKVFTFFSVFTLRKSFVVRIRGWHHLYHIHPAKCNMLLSEMRCVLPVEDQNHQRWILVDHRWSIQAILFIMSVWNLELTGLLCPDTKWINVVCFMFSVCPPTLFDNNVLYFARCSSREDVWKFICCAVEQNCNKKQTDAGEQSGEDNSHRAPANETTTDSDLKRFRIWVWRGHDWVPMLKGELQKFREGQKNPEPQDPLLWWKVNACRFPKLTCFVRQV